MTERPGTTHTLEQSRWPELRRLKAESITSVVMQTLDDLIEDRGEAYYRVLAAFMELGIDFVTDEDRRNAGLEPRLQGGWTDHELRVLEAKRMQEMLRPLYPTAFTPTVFKSE